MVLNNDMPKPVYILSMMAEILLFHLMVNKRAMNICQMLGYNGFKRWHRYNIMCFMYKLNTIDNKAIDDFYTETNVSSREFTYNPKDLKEHLESWLALIESDLKKLGVLSVQFFDETGILFAPIEHTICTMYKQKEKIKRCIKRFNENSWMPHDMHIVDDCIHAKYKKKEDKNAY